MKEGQEVAVCGNGEMDLGEFYYDDQNPIDLSVFEQNGMIGFEFIGKRIHNLNDTYPFDLGMACGGSKEKS